MKKFILDRETDELIPWSEFVHEKDQETSEKDIDREVKVVESNQDKSIEEEGKRQLAEADTQVNKESDKEETPEKKDEIISEDKVVIGSGLSGPPGEKKEVNKKKTPLKRKFKGPKLKTRETDIVDSPPVKKREWISL